MFLSLDSRILPPLSILSTHGISLINDILLGWIQHVFGAQLCFRNRRNLASTLQRTVAVSDFNFGHSMQTSRGINHDFTKERTRSNWICCRHWNMLTNFSLAQATSAHPSSLCPFQAATQDTWPSHLFCWRQLPLAPRIATSMIARELVPSKSSASWLTIR